MTMKRTATQRLADGLVVLSCLLLLADTFLYTIAFDFLNTAGCIIAQCTIAMHIINYAASL